MRILSSLSLQFAALFLGASLTSTTANAAGQRPGGIDLSLGLGTALRSQGGFAQGFQLQGGYGIVPFVTSRLFFWKVSAGAEVSGGGDTIKASDSLSGFGVEALYPFIGTSWSAGLKLALLKHSRDGSVTGVTTGVPTISSSNSTLAPAPTLTYEIPSGSLTFGGEASYFYSLSSSVPKALSLMAVGRFGF